MIGALQHRCDLDLVLFFDRHPRALLTREQLAAYVGYDVNQVERSLELLTEAGLLERSKSLSRDARMYVVKQPKTEWLVTLLAFASTPEGRLQLLQAMEASRRDVDDGQETNPSSRVGTPEAL